MNNNAKITGIKPVLMIIPFLLFYFPLVSRAEPVPEGMGNIIWQNNVTFAPNAIYNEYVAVHSVQGRERGFTIEFKPAQKKLKMIADYGSKLYGGDTLNQFIKHAQDEGYIVFGGINADGYNINTGVPDGPVIHDGRLAAYPNKDFCVGFTADGGIKMGLLQLNFNLKLPSSDLQVSHLNADMGESGCYLFSGEFGGSTQNTAYKSYDLICDIIAGKQAIGQAMTLKVVAIKDDTLNTAIAKNQIIISTAKTAANQTSLAILKRLNAGDSFDMEISRGTMDAGMAGAKGPDWSAVQEAIGALSVILWEGKVVTKDFNIHPRTCLGVKSDGTVVLFVLDGRQPGYSKGLNLPDAAEFLRRQGCMSAVNLDGGGSSTIAVRKPGDAGLTILNRPSDGGQRTDGNAWILVSNMTGNNKLKHLHINPVNPIVLTGAILNFSVKGTNGAYMPVDLPGAAIWSVDGSIGQIGTDGQFTASMGNSSDGTVAVAFGGKKAATKIRVVKDINIRFDVTSLSLNSGSTYHAAVRATDAATAEIPVICQNSQFSWSVTGDIGTIDQNGTFTAASGSGLNGSIIAAYGLKSCEISVSVGKLPVVAEDFENGIAGWSAGGIGIPAGGVAVSEETKEDYVRVGKKSLKLEYNMKGSRSGTAGCFLKANTPFKITGYPTAIGMWVYGDGQGHLLRGMLKDGAGAVFSVNYIAAKSDRVNWRGWKYVEATIPQNKILPLAIYMPVRYMETDNHKKSAGVLYIDGIRLIYGNQSNDLTPPLIKDISPSDGSILTGYTNIQVEFMDGTGIDPCHILFYIDDTLKEDYIYNESAGNIQWNTKELSEGKHKFTLMLRDFYGNETVQSWYYTWDTSEDAYLD